jgi:hypothetical protein
MFCDRNDKEDDGKCHRRSLAADEGAPKKAEPTQLRNEAPLNCVSLRSELDCEATCGAVKGQDERPLQGALDSPASRPGALCSTEENMQGFHGETDTTGGTVGRPSCQSSILSDPNAKFSVELWRNPQKTRNGGSADLTSQTQPKRPPRRP